MKVRTKSEILSLDDELNLFNEDDWQFIGGVVSSKAENYQYFNDVRDTDFDIKINNRETLKNILTVCVIFCIFGIGIWILKYCFISKDNEEYQKMLDMQNVTVEDGSKANYLDGELCDENVIYSTSIVFNSYFNVLKEQANYDSLDSYCVGHSSFLTQYNKYMSKMKCNYDIYDCYARSLKSVGSYCTFNRMDRVIKKDDTYYCYAVLNVPTTVDIQKYVNTYKVNMTKYFTTNEQTDNNFYHFLLQTMKDYALPTTESIYCFEMKKQSDGNYYLVDDDQLTSLCVTDFVSAIAYMSILVEKI